MKKLKTIIFLLFTLSIAGCFVFPWQTVMPLKTKVIDSETGAPIEGAVVLRIICDIHDFQCENAFYEKSASNDKGIIRLSGKRKWGVWFPAPGGVPVPNHQIIIWKKGYAAFIFSQYGDDIEKFAYRVKNQEIRDAIKEVPKKREYLPEEVDPNSILINGKVELRRLKK